MNVFEGFGNIFVVTASFRYIGSLISKATVSWKFVSFARQQFDAIRSRRITRFARIIETWCRQKAAEYLKSENVFKIRGVSDDGFQRCLRRCLSYRNDVIALLEKIYESSELSVAASTS